jgi:hypothetical protein
MEESNMASFHEYMAEYRKQLEKGAIQQAYRGLMEYIMALRTHFQKMYPDFLVPGSVYYGYMDMSYFSVIPRSLKERNLKIAIVYVHETGRFEVWLSGYNRQVQQEYWKVIQESGWDKYRLVPSPRTYDSIIESVLVDHPDFRDLDALTAQIETGTLAFIRDVEAFLSRH